jgi:hypothetical protein
MRFFAACHQAISFMRKNVSIYFNNSNLKKIKCYVWIDCMLGNIMDREGSLSYKNNGDSKFIFLSPKNWNRSLWKHSKKNCLPHKNDFWRVRTHFWGFPKTMAMSQKTTESGPDNKNSFPCCDVGAKKRKTITTERWHDATKPLPWLLAFVLERTKYVCGK